jgi:predicted dehydrogenase
VSYNAGIIGAGGVAGTGFIGTRGLTDIEQVRSTHAGGYDGASGIDLVAVCDTDEDQLREFGELWDVPAERRYRDHQAMLAAEDLDVVSVCTPTFLHHQHTLDAVNAPNPPGVIWCEKPIASSVTESEEMVRACSEAGIELVVNYPRRFDHDFRALESQIGELLGDVRSINLQFKRELLRNGTHMIDEVVYLLEEEISQLSGFLTGSEELSGSIAEGDVDDQGGGALLQTREGTFVTVDCTVSREIWSGYVRLLGTGGKLVIDEGEDEWRYWSFDGEDHVETSLPEAFDGGETPDLDAAFPAAAGHAVDLLNGDATNHSPGSEAVHVVEILTGIFTSSYTGGHLSLPLERPLRDVSIRSW